MAERVLGLQTATTGTRRRAPLAQAPRVDVDEALAIADGALGAAGHEVRDPVLRDITRRMVAGELTFAEGDALIQRRIAER